MASKMEHLFSIEKVAMVGYYGTRCLPRKGSLTSCAWAPDGSYLAYIAGEKTVEVFQWTHHSRRTVQPSVQYPQIHPSTTITTRRPVLHVSIGSSLTSYRSGKLMLAVAMEAGRIEIWDIPTGRLLQKLTKCAGSITGLKLAPDGSLRLASTTEGREEGEIRIWKLSEKGKSETLGKKLHKWWSDCVWSPDAKILVSIGQKYPSGGEVVYLWDTEEMKFLRTIEFEVSRDVKCKCDFSPDGAMLVTALSCCHIFIYDVHTGQNLSHLSSYNGYGDIRPVVAFCHDGRHIASIKERFVYLWDIYKPGPHMHVEDVKNGIFCCYSPYGVLAVTQHHGISFWQSPMQMQSLQQLCRMTVRRNVPFKTLGAIHLPTRIKRFLFYQDLQ